MGREFKMYEIFLNAALQAAKMVIKPIMDIYNSHDLNVEIKSDNSPVTKADKLADKILKDYLSSLFPNHGFLTEESFDDFSRLNKDYVWIIDPIDGTKDFINKDDEFTTNIALCYKHEIVVGVVLIPAYNEIYYAIKGKGAFHIDKNGSIKKIHVNNKTENLTCLISVFHHNVKEQNMILRHADKITKVLKKGSSIKACLISSGEAEISYRLSPMTKEWDTAAINIIVNEAGGIFLEPNGKRLTYNRKDVYNRNGYIICNNMKNFLL